MTVSVVIVTYKHEAFIAEAIEGVLLQQVDFTVEIIISDDCSPDGTAEIVQKYIDTYPNGHWIKYTRHEKNKGMMLNFIWTLEQVKGKYIALCDGDDYWTDPYKLQKQVAFLEANSKVIMVASKSISENFAKKKQINNEGKSWRIIDINYLMKHNFIPTGSVCYRKIQFDEREFDYLVNMPFGDFALYTILQNHGEIWMTSEEQVFYRIHDGGVFTNSTMEARLLLMIDGAKKTYKFIQDSNIKRSIYENLIYRTDELIELYRQKKQFTKQNLWRFKKLYFKNSMILHKKVKLKS